MDIAQVDRESRERDDQLDRLVKELLIRVEALEGWKDRHRYEGHG
jgi:hypothetical protein